MVAHSHYAEAPMEAGVSVPVIPVRGFCGECGLATVVLVSTQAVWEAVAQMAMAEAMAESNTREVPDGY